MEKMKLCAIFFWSYLNMILKVETETVIPAVLGSTVTLECKITQTDALVWDRPTTPPVPISIRGTIQHNFNSSKYLLVESSSKSQESLIIHSLELPDDGFYRCYDLSNSGYKQEFKVNILVQPVSFNISGPTGPVNEGSEQVVTCDINGGKPAPVISWYLIDYKKTVTQLNGMNQDIQYGNGIVNRRGLLRFVVTRQMYRGTIACNASMSYFYDLQHKFQLDINLSPLTPVIQRTDGFFKDGTINSIQCDSTGSKPAANITWFIDGTELPDIRQQVFQDADRTFITSGFVTLQLSKGMDGKTLTCAATNVVLQANGQHPLTTNLTLLATYVPRVTGENGTKVVKEYDNITLTCSIDARPETTRDDISWTRDGQTISGSRFKILNGATPNLQIYSVSRTDKGKYQCQASNRLGVGTGPSLHLDVLYRPECTHKSVEKYAASFGETARFTCHMTANPSNVTMLWRYRTSNTPMKQNLPVIVSGEITYTSITVLVSSDAQYTDVECIATNMIGSSRKPCLFKIVPPGPPEIPSNCTIASTRESQMLVQCTSGFSGGADQFFLLQQLEGSQFLTVQNRSSSEFVINDVRPGVNYTYRVCSASVTHHRTPRCSEAVSMTLKSLHGENIGKQRVAAASTQNNGPFIAAGVVGFIALCCIIAIVVFFYRRSKQVCNATEPDIHRSSSFSTVNTRGMTEVTDYYKHAQFESMVGRPIHNTSSSTFDRQRSVRFNYDVTLYGYDPTKTIRKSKSKRNFKRRLSV